VVVVVLVVGKFVCHVENSALTLVEGPGPFRVEERPYFGVGKSKLPSQGLVRREFVLSIMPDPDNNGGNLVVDGTESRDLD
jgi:hypothetical protein